MKKISRKRIERFTTMLAFYNEAYPDKNPLVNKYWERIRDKHVMDCLKYGKCAICGEEDLLGEYLLTFVCDKPECNRKIAEEYEEILKEWHKKKH